MLEARNLWVGVNPTTIPQTNQGEPSLNEFPLQGSTPRVIVPLAELDLSFTCDVYMMPHAVLVNESTSYSGFAGEVVFNSRKPLSSGRLFRTQAACFAPTPPVTTLVPSQAPALVPSLAPNQAPAPVPSLVPSVAPSLVPTLAILDSPTRSPSQHPTTPSPTRSRTLPDAPTISPNLLGTPTPDGTPAPTLSQNFDIHVVYLTSPSDKERQLITSSVARLETVFSKDYATLLCFKRNDTICEVKLGQDICIDDFLLFVEIQSATSIGSKAGPCSVTQDYEQVRVGKVMLEADDFDNQELFPSLFMHLTLHALGFGPRWPIWGLSTSDSAHYLGEQGNDGFVEVGGDASQSIPLAAKKDHWDEVIFHDELMSPQLNNGEFNPLSVMTIKSLKDMGFHVNLGTADIYSIANSRRRSRLLLHTTDDILNVDLEYVNISSIKPGREEDAQRELEFARSHIQFKPTPEPTAQPADVDVGLIVGIVIALLILLCLLLFCCCWWRRRNSKQDKQDKSFTSSDGSSKKESTSSGTSGALSKGSWSEQRHGDKIFWVNDETGEFSWAPPPGVQQSFPEFRAPKPAAVTQNPKKANGSAPHAWKEATDDAGNVYWVNEETGEFSWVAPTSPAFNLNHSSERQAEDLNRTSDSPVSGYREMHDDSPPVAGTRRMSNRDEEEVSMMPPPPPPPRDATSDLEPNPYQEECFQPLPYYSGRSRMDESYL